MFKTNKNIVRLNSFAVTLFGFAFQSDILKSQVDMRTVVSVLVLLVVTAVALLVYNKINERHEKVLKSKLSSH